MVFFVIVLLIGLIIGLCLLIKNALFTSYVIRNFKKCNVVVDGKKGSGKDLLFQKVINKRKDFYYSNISYGGKKKLITIKDISIAPKDNNGNYEMNKNTYLHFITDNVVKTERRFKEKKDIYISDGGIFLPSYMDSTLYKLFPTFPIYYALSRHLYNSNLHVNVQNFTRLWKAIREQADFFIHVKYTKNILFWTFTRVTTYDKYESAIQYLEPLKSRLLNKDSQVQADLYTASNGEIKKGWIIQLKRNIKYNTRAFEKIVLKGNRKH